MSQAVVIRILYILVLAFSGIGTANAGWFGSLFRGYDNYTECMVVEQQKGATDTSSYYLCIKLTDEGKIACETANCKGSLELYRKYN